MVFTEHCGVPVKYFSRNYLFLKHDGFFSLLFSAEIDLHTKCVVDVEANKVILNPVNTNLSKGDAR